MSPWVPPYFGSWDSLVNALLHDPFLGSGGGGRPPLTHLDALRFASPVPSPWMLGPVPDPWVLGPQPVPWALGPQPLPWNAAVGYVLSLIALREAAAQVPNEELRAQLGERAGQALEAFIDDYCGTHPWPWPFPWPGPPPWVVDTVSQLTLAANTLQSGAVREAALKVAGQMLAAANRAAEQA